MGGKHDPAVDPATAPVYILMFGAHGGSGVVRTVVNLANHLVGHREVEIISLFRAHRQQRFEIDPRIKVTVLHDYRQAPPRWKRVLAGHKTRLRPKPRDARMNLLTDVLLARKLRSLPPGILLTTRPSLHLAAVLLAPRRLVVVGQDHQHFKARFRVRRQARVMRFVIPRLDAFAVLTKGDARDYRRRFGSARTVIRCIPNALPWDVAATPAALRSKVIVTVGRLDHQKGHDRMIRSYAEVARRHPDWQLHIYGVGRDQKSLARLIDDLGLEEQVQLKGYSTDIRDVMARASVYALASRSEGFAMVLIEAMSVGLPVVAMDCPRGPREIVDDGKNGFLVPDGDETAFSDALLRLIDDEELRRRIGAQALEDARGYELDVVSRRWERLFEAAAMTRAARDAEEPSRRSSWPLVLLRPGRTAR